jgi:two-component system chemotaxis sensor kinase CheA
VTSSDPELLRLLIQELERHLITLETDDPEQSRRAVHALKGSAGLAGERELAAALLRLERRLRDGDSEARRDTARLVKAVIARLKRGEPAVTADWPDPPDDLGPSKVDPMVRAEYSAEIADRIVRIDEAMTREDDPTLAASTIYRHVHTMKGAASAVGDEPMTWFCHGLEEWLKTATGSREAAVAALREVSRWRAVLGALVDDPDAALRTLRASSKRRSGAPSVPPSMRPHDEDGRGDEATIRVGTAAVDRLLDRMVSIGLVRERIAVRSELAREHSRRARKLRVDLAEALRLIGPPRPWGAPAAALTRIERATKTLARFGDELEHLANDMRASDQVLKDDTVEAKRDLSAMRQTPMKRMFAWMATAVEAEARRSNRTVVVRTRGADETIDRRLAEALLEPCLQLARNAVAHGIETPTTREALGKSGVGTITLSAKKSGNRLFVVIADDGAGVDVDAVRERAVESGAVTRALAHAADDNTLLALLFLPGFSTREGTDLLAGRGIGLDLALASVQRLGGAIRLSSKHGEGFEASVEVPIESGLAHVLWVTAGGIEYAVVATHARRVRRNDALDADRIPHLAACLDPRPNVRASFAIELDVAGQENAAIVVGVDEVGRTEDVLVRPLSPLVSGMGPFAGAIARGDGSLRLAIDVHALAPRARALGRVPDGRTSDFPSDHPPSGSPREPLA